LFYKNGDLVGKIKPTYSIKTLRKDFYAVLNDDIFEYLQKKSGFCKEICKIPLLIL
jgi:hypothetical protein